MPFFRLRLAVPLICALAVAAPAFAGDLLKIAAGQRGNPVHHERGLSEHDVLGWGAKGTHDQIEQLVRAVADDDLVARDAEALRQRGSQGHRR